MDHACTIPIFVISLPGSSRFDRLEKQLTEFDIPFERIEAIDGRTISEEKLPRLYDEHRALKKLGRVMTRGEIGNALSHREVWRLIIVRNISAALVLEEDAIIDQAFCSIVRTVQGIPRKIGYLSLYALGGRVFRRASGQIGEFKLHRAATGLPNTVAYFIRANYARMLLNRGPRVENPTDWPLSYLDREQYLAVPMPVMHHLYGSVIHPERAMIMIQQRRKAGSIWPSWVPAWLRATAYITCVVYLLRPDRYDGFVDYFKRRVAPPVRFAMHETIEVAQLGDRDRATPKQLSKDVRNRVSRHSQ